MYKRPLYVDALLRAHNPETYYMDRQSVNSFGQSPIYFAIRGSFPGQVQENRPHGDDNLYTVRREDPRASQKAARATI